MCCRTRKSTACLICLKASHAEPANCVKYSTYKPMPFGKPILKQGRVINLSSSIVRPMFKFS